MKKAIAILIVLIIAAAGGATYFFWKRPVALGELKAAGYLPPDTVAFVEITDMQRSKARWQETALHKIAEEPEVAAFLVKPKSLVPASGDLDRFRALNPKEVFLAVTGRDAAGPKVVGGFDFSGNRKDAESLVADLKNRFKSRYPDGQSDLEPYGSSQIETFTHDNKTIATVFKGPWFLASNDLDLLKSTLDRVAAKTGSSASLRDDATYKFCVAKLPADSDFTVFVAMKGIVDDLTTMLEAAPNADRSTAEDLKKIQGIAASMKFDGENLHDALYFYRPGGEARAPLAFNSKAYTSPDTVLYFALNPTLKQAPALPNAALDRSGMLSALSGVLSSLSEAGLGFEEFKAAFGPEAGAAINWGKNSPMAGLALALDVRDKEKAGKFLDTLSRGLPKQEVDGTQYYALPELGEGFIHVSPVFALTDKALLFGIDRNSVQDVVSSAKSDAPRIDESPVFKAASALVPKPTDSFAYVDTRALFEKVYGLAALPLRLGGALSPASRYFDFGKMPFTAAPISKHLGPIVFSQSTDENGTLSESVGPITFTEVAFGVGVGGGIVGAMQSGKIRRDQESSPLPFSH